jgi:hypothetical protein
MEADLAERKFENTIAGGAIAQECYPLLSATHE